MNFIPDSSPGPISRREGLEPAGTAPQAPKEFQSYMQETKGAAPQEVTPLAPSAPSSGPPSLSTLLAQTRSMQDTLGTVHDQLSTPNLRLKRSQTHLLKNKLTNAHDYLRQASTKLGVNSPPLNLPSGANAIGRFLAYINDGQDQLIQAQHKLHEMSLHGGQINPAEMLSVTVKMNLAQQEIEYSSTLLSRVIEAFRQIMNMQL